MSPKMAAIVGCILGMDWTKPRITGLMVTTDGGLLASTDEDPLFDEFLGSSYDLLANWNRLLDVAELSEEERTLAEKRFTDTIQHA